MVPPDQWREMVAYAAPHRAYIVCHDCGRTGGDEASPLCGICGRACCRNCFDDHHLTDYTEETCGPCPEMVTEDEVTSINPPLPIHCFYKDMEIARCLDGTHPWGNGGGYLEGPGEPMPRDLLKREEQVR